MAGLRGRGFSHPLEKAAGACGGAVGWGGRRRVTYRLRNTAGTRKAQHQPRLSQNPFWEVTVRSNEDKVRGDKVRGHET